MLRVGLLQKLGQGSLAGVIQIELALVGRPGAGVVCVQRLHNGLPSGIEGRLLGFFLRQRDSYLLLRRRSVGLDAAVMDAGAVHRLADPVGVWRLLELNIDQCAAAKVDSQLDAMPEEDRKDSGNTEDQR